jgi:IS4 transposase
MMLDAVLGRFVEQCPVAVMAQLALQRALPAGVVDAVFEAHAEQQYTRELLFSTVVDLMALVAVGLRPSLHAAGREARAAGTLGVSLQALYDKVNHTEPGVLRALVRESAARLAPVAARLRPAAPWLAGYRVRVLDGNHLPATEHRVKPLRAARGAALPGQGLVVYAPELDLVVDLVAGEDAHAQEPSYVAPLAAAAGPGELWLADRNFPTRAFLGALAARGAAVLVREHGTRPHPEAAGARRGVGRGASGVVYEQPVTCPVPPPGAPPLRLRRVEVELDTPLESGETTLRLLTTLPAAAADAVAVAALYRRRWTVEGLFQRLEGVFHSEVASLGRPRAALFAFAAAVVAYNALAVVQAAVEAEAAARAPAAPVPISMYQVAHAVREHYRGLMVAVPPAVWARYAPRAPRGLAATLRGLAAHVRLEAYRKYPRGASGPRRTAGYVPREELQHISTARVLETAKRQRRHQAP